MKRLFLPAGLLLGCLFSALLPAGEATAANPTAELKALVAQTTAKLREGKKTAADLAPDLAAFDALLAKYQGQKTDDVAQILYLHAMLYGEVLGDMDKAKQLLEKLKADFPATKPAASADAMYAALEQRQKSLQAQAGRVGQPAPELHFTWANRDGLKTLSGLKGKVVVLDFWATWCGPCITSFPQIRQLAEHYQGTDVEVVGVTSVQGFIMSRDRERIDTQGDPKKEMALMADYIKAMGITWTIAFSEEQVFNPEYGVTGIPHMAIVAPDGKLRHTGLHPAMPHSEKIGMIDALLKEFGRPLPARSTKS